jgi:excisionase family DNA binding protein
MTKSAHKRKLLTITAAAKEMGISRNTLSTWIRNNEGPPYLRVGKRRMFNTEIISQWIKARSGL